MWSPASAMLRMANVSAACPLDTQQGTDAALERGDALLDGVLRGVHDPRVDVAGLGEAEEGGGVVGVAEDVGRRLVDRQRAGAGGGVGALAGMDLLGLEGPGGGVGAHVVLLMSDEVGSGGRSGGASCGHEPGVAGEQCSQRR